MGSSAWAGREGKDGDNRGCLLTFRALLDKGSTDMFAEGVLDLGERGGQGHIFSPLRIKSYI